MLLSEIKSELSRLTAAELVEVERHLRGLRWLNDPAMPDRVAAAVARLETGSGVSGEEIERRFASRLGDTAA
jgi:hypothetical protein